MKNNEKQIYTDSPIYKLLIDEFESISRAARKLGFSRKAIYKFIEAGTLATRAKNKIIAAGYNPETFKPEAH